MDFQHSLYEFFSVCCPTMKVSIWANHSANIFGVSNNLHLTELIAILKNPCLQGTASFSAILNPTAFAIIQNEASNGIHRTECRCQCSHQPPERGGSHSEVVSVSTLGWLQEFQVVGVLWDNGFLEPSEDRVKSHCKKETTRRTTLSSSSGHKELSSFCSRKFHVCDAVSVNISQKRQRKAGNPVFSSTEKIQE